MSILKVDRTCSARAAAGHSSSAPSLGPPPHVAATLPACAARAIAGPAARTDLRDTAYCLRHAHRAVVPCASRPVWRCRCGTRRASPRHQPRNQACARGSLRHHPRAGHLADQSLAVEVRAGDNPRAPGCTPRAARRCSAGPLQAALCYAAQIALREQTLKRSATMRRPVAPRGAAEHPPRPRWQRRIRMLVLVLVLVPAVLVPVAREGLGPSLNAWLRGRVAASNVARPSQGADGPCGAARGAREGACPPTPHTRPSRCAPWP